MSKTSQVIYIKANRSTQTQATDIYLKDVATVLCADSALETRIKTIKLAKMKEQNPERLVISIMDIIKLIQSLAPEAAIINIGETDLVIRHIRNQKKKGFSAYPKILLVALVCFFGAAFTIMAFHNDIGIIHVFGKLYLMIMGEKSTGFTVLEISYSVGLAAGIILFFNHIGKRTLTSDPTPIAVEMRVYEEEVDKAVIETASREHWEKE